MAATMFMRVEEVAEEMGVWTYVNTLDTKS